MWVGVAQGRVEQSSWAVLIFTCGLAQPREDRRVKKAARSENTRELPHWGHSSGPGERVGAIRSYLGDHMVLVSKWGQLH